MMLPTGPLISGEPALAASEDSAWGCKYPTIGQSWRRAWAEKVSFYAFSAQVRRLLNTMNQIEALIIAAPSGARGHFPTDDAAQKLLYLVLNRTEIDSTHAGAESALPGAMPRSPQTAVMAFTRRRSEFSVALGDNYRE
ncbi:transposase [Azospirillum argentinense]